MGNGHLRLYNGNNDCINITYDSDSYFIDKLGFHQNKDIEVDNFKVINYTLSSVDCTNPSIGKQSVEGAFRLQEAEAISYFVADINDDLYRFKDDSDKSSKGLPAVR